MSYPAFTYETRTYEIGKLLTWNCKQTFGALITAFLYLLSGCNTDSRNR